MQPNVASRRLPLAVVAVACVVPAAIFFAAVIGRSLQPIEHEPARTLDAIVAWFSSLGDPGVLVLLMALPAIGMVLGAGLVVSALREDVALPQDLVALGTAAITVLRRPAFILGLVTVLFGLGFFAVMAVHAIAG